MENKQVVIEIERNEVHSLETAIKGVLAAVFYGICSVSSAVVSKALMDTLEFDYPVFIMVSQMIFTICVLELLCIFGVLDLPTYTLKRGLAFAAPAFFYGTNSVLALTALSHMNLAMYGVLKRCVPLSTMLLGMLVLKKDLPSKVIMFSVILLTAGCIIAGYGDLGFNLTAYICGIGSNFTQALYLLLVQKFSEHHMSVAETLQLNSINTLPLLFIAAVANGEMQDVISYPRMKEIGFICMFFMSIGVGMLLNYSLFLCTSLTSALTTSVVGGLKALAQTVIGLFTFGGVSHNAATYIGITMNLSGGIAYIWARYKETKAKTGGLPGLKKIMSFSSFVKADVTEGQNGYVHNGKILSKHRHASTSNLSS